MTEIRFSNRGFSSFVIDRGVLRVKARADARPPDGRRGLDSCAPPVCWAFMRSTLGADRRSGQAGTSCQVVPAAIMALRRTMSFRMQAVRATLGGFPRSMRR